VYVHEVKTKGKGKKFKCETGNGAGIVSRIKLIRIFAFHVEVPLPFKKNRISSSSSHAVTLWLPNTCKPVINDIAITPNSRGERSQRVQGNWHTHICTNTHTHTHTHTHKHRHTHTHTHIHIHTHTHPHTHTHTYRWRAERAMLTVQMISSENVEFFWYVWYRFRVDEIAICVAL
jgi:hypothetical protein